MRVLVSTLRRTGIGTSASRVWADATPDVHAFAGENAPPFHATIHGSDAVARETRAKGVLLYDLADQVEGADPIWKAFRDGHRQQTPQIPTQLEQRYASPTTRHCVTVRLRAR